MKNEFGTMNARTEDQVYTVVTFQTEGINLDVVVVDKLDKRKKVRTGQKTKS